MFTSHGRQIPWTPVDGKEEVAFGCTGIARCSVCKPEIELVLSHKPKESESSTPLFTLVNIPVETGHVQINPAHISEVEYSYLGAEIRMTNGNCYLVPNVGAMKLQHILSGTWPS